jgi:hypothetical protein
MPPGAAPEADDGQGRRNTGHLVTFLRHEALGGNGLTTVESTEPVSLHPTAVLAAAQLITASQS